MPVRPVPPGTRCAGKNRPEQDTIGRRTDGRFTGPDPYPNPARHSHLLRCSSAAIAMQCNRSYQAQLLFHKCSQLKSSTLGRVPPYILFKHTRESNRSPALRSDLGSHRPGHSFALLNRGRKKVGHLLYFCAAFGGSNLYAVGAGE